MILKEPYSFIIQQLIDELFGINILHPYRNLGNISIEPGFTDLFLFMNTELSIANQKFKDFMFDYLNRKDMIRSLFK